VMRPIYTSSLVLKILCLPQKGCISNVEYMQKRQQLTLFPPLLVFSPSAPTCEVKPTYSLQPALGENTKRGNKVYCIQGTDN